MFEALLNKKVDAVVSAAPVLLYYAAHEGKGWVKVVGPEFNTAPLAIMFQLDSPLRRKVDGALVTLRENGTYQQLFDKWALLVRTEHKWLRLSATLQFIAHQIARISRQRHRRGHAFDPHNAPYHLVGT